jgi:integrase
MTLYDFEVLKDGALIQARSIALHEISCAWPVIARLAKRFHEPGHKFRVTDRSGGIVILTGEFASPLVRAARDFLSPVFPFLGRKKSTRGLAATVEPVGPVIRSYRGGHLKANSVVNWYVALFQELGFEGCSSHSGRRSFITVAARNIHRSGCSLRDVQLLAGHQSIETTERYIDGDTWAQRRLVGYV